MDMITGILILCMMLTKRGCPLYTAKHGDHWLSRSGSNPRTKDKYAQGSKAAANVFPLNTFPKVLLTEQNQPCQWIPLENVNKPVRKLIHEIRIRLLVRTWYW